MDITALIVVIVGTAAFFGFSIWMAFYSRRQNAASEENKAENGSERSAEPVNPALNKKI